MRYIVIGALWLAIVGAALYIDPMIVPWLYAAGLALLLVVWWWLHTWPDGFWGFLRHDD